MDVWVLAYKYYDGPDYLMPDSYTAQVHGKGFKTWDEASNYLTWLDQNYPSNKSDHKRYYIQRVTISG